MNDENGILQTAAEWQAAAKTVALATVIGTWGSSPRPVGSLLLVADDGGFVGSVSGGCVEGAVISAAATAMADGVPRVLSFGVSNAEAWAAGLACGGTVEIFVNPLGAGTVPVAHILKAMAAKQPVVLVTDLTSGAQALIGSDGPHGPLAVDDTIITAARAIKRSETLDHAGRRLFLAVIAPPKRLAVIGAVHIAQDLATMAAMAGYDVTVIDPRGAFAATARFPGVTLIDDWPDTALAAFALDRSTAVVTLTHDPKLDDPALAAALQSDCFFIGALGSRKTQAARFERLRAAGFAEPALARIHGPVGLAIGAVSPAEIAIAILAQMTAVLHGQSGGATL